MQKLNTGYVCVYGDDTSPAFVSTWNNGLDLMVRKLGPNESVELSNE